MIFGLGFFFGVSLFVFLILWGFAENFKLSFWIASYFFGAGLMILLIGVIFGVIK